MKRLGRVNQTRNKVIRKAKFNKKKHHNKKVQINKVNKKINKIFQRNKKLKTIH